MVAAHLDPMPQATAAHSKDMGVLTLQGAATTTTAHRTHTTQTTQGLGVPATTLSMVMVQCMADHRPRMGADLVTHTLKAKQGDRRHHHITT